MMEWVLVFLIGLFFSFIGSIPPGMINVSVLQLAMQNKRGAALSFTTAAVLVELIYAAIAVRFQIFLSQNTSITEHFQLITALVLLGLGIMNVVKNKHYQMQPKRGEKRNAFKRGALISLANPLAIPFWLAVTAYLQSMGWISAERFFWSYITGISTGTLLLLGTIIVLASRYSLILNNHFLVYRVPGLVFIGMGGWSFYQWMV